MVKKKIQKVLSLFLAVAMLGTGIPRIPVNQTFAATAGGTVIYQNDFELDAGAVTVTVTGAAIGVNNKVLEFNVAGDVNNSWLSVFQQDLFFDYAEKIYSGATLSFDLLLPVASTYVGGLKAQAVTKMGDGWTWTQSAIISTISIGDFTDLGNGYKKASVSIPFGNEIETVEGLKDIIPCLAASNCDYIGKIYLDNVKLVNGVAQPVVPELPVVEPINFSFDSVDAINGWTDGGNYQYSGGLTIGYGEPSSGNGAMQLDVDYSGNSTSSWSEAKVTYAFDQQKELNGYNRFSLDLIYDPAKMTTGSFQLKLFSGIIDKSIAIDTNKAINYGTGLKKATVVIELTSTANAIDNFVIGLIGSNTDYKGSLYVDNVSFSQIIASDSYVVATKSSEAQTSITVNSDSILANGITQATSSEIKLVDDKAIAATAKLYAYLEAVGKTDSVLYGHQNDIHHKTGNKALTNSDTKDVTGSIAAVMGIDTLSLTGNELSVAAWNLPLADRVAACEKVTKEASDQGAIITLSAHMPNFEVIDERVKNDVPGSTDQNSVGILSDGSYNFSGYTPGTLTGNIVSRIMPGQDLNYLYRGYLDMVAAYGKSLEDDNISVLFRPFHENTGSWFWWGAAFSDQEAYKNLYKYTVEYLRDEKSVHNFIYVYGPSSDAESIADYEKRYPGDDYVDMVGFDMYHQIPVVGDAFIDQLKAELSIVEHFATEHKKLFAVTETGIANGNGQALLKTGNERKDWYNEVLEAVAPTKASYFLLWANFGETSGFYTPYVVSNTATTMRGHEMLDNFIDFYNKSNTVFASQMGDFSKISTATIPNTAVTGYITAPSSGSRVLKAVTVEASVSNATDNSVVKFVAKDKSGTLVKEIAATKKSKGKYLGEITADMLASLGVSVGTISLEVDTIVCNTINAKFNMPEPVADPTVVDTFENYYGENAMLNTSWSTGKGTGCSIIPTLSSKSYDGDYGLEFKYSLVAGGYVGVTKSLNGADWSSKNALQLWTVPDNKKQRIVVQVTSGGNVFEVYLNTYDEYINATGAEIVTIPFSSFVGRDNAAAVFDSSSIESVGLWCNAVVPDGENAASYKLNSVIYYDSIKAITSDVKTVTFTNDVKPTQSTNSSGSSTPTPVKTDNPNAENGGIATTTKEGDKTVTTIRFDEEKFNKKLQSLGEKAVFAILINTKADVSVGELSGQMIKNMKTKNIVLELKTENASYKLPTGQINIDEISKELGKSVELKDIIVRVKVSSPTAETIKIVNASAEKGGFSIVVAPVEFTVSCTAGDKTIEIKKFDVYVERTIAIPDSVDPGKVTTAIVTEADGTVRSVPTKFVAINGRNFAVINSLTNSNYSIVYNAIEFKDVANHWAKEAINDMGSRLVISGVGNNMFEPDRNITRAEFAAIIVKSLGLKPGTGNNSFDDVSAEDWYCKYIETAYEYGVISGYSTVKFGPLDKITRKQAMTMIAKAMKITGLSIEFQADEVESDKTFSPKDQITRAEVTVIIEKMLQKLGLI